MTIPSKPNGAAPPRKYAANSRNHGDTGDAAAPSAATSPRKVRGRPFRPGNPGKPKGARHRGARLLEALVGAELHDIARACIEAAKGGNMAAAKLILDRVSPPARESIGTFRLPCTISPETVPIAMAALLTGAARGEIGAEQAATIFRMLAIYQDAVTVADFDARLRQVEQQQERLP